MTRVGFFGKLPARGDFVKESSGSPIFEAYRTWLEGANEEVVREDRALPSGPIGFMFGGVDGVLVGTLVDSRDKVGRRFPFSLFCEVARRDEGGDRLRFPGIPNALAGPLSRFSLLVRRLGRASLEEIKEEVARVRVPDLAQLGKTSAADLRRLDRISLRQILARMFGPGDTRFYGTEALLRACLEARCSADRGIALDFSVESDVEMLFWLACVEAGIDANSVTPSALWNVASRRLIIVLGRPDAEALCFLSPRRGSFQRLWPTTTSLAEAAQGAKARLEHSCTKMLENPGDRVASDFVEWIRSWVNDVPQRRA